MALGSVQHIFLYYIISRTRLDYKGPTPIAGLERFYYYKWQFILLLDFCIKKYGSVLHFLVLKTVGIVLLVHSIKAVNVIIIYFLNIYLTNLLIISLLF